MPSHDLINDAYVMSPSGGSVTVDTTGASWEPDEENQLGTWPGVWLKLDARNWDKVTLSLQVTGASLPPYLELYYDGYGDFDPANPDFSKLNFGLLGKGNDDWYGDGTTSPGWKSFPTWGRRIYWLHVTDWDYLSFGEFTVEWTALETRVNFQASPDNIKDGVLLVADGAWHSFTLDMGDATLEADEAGDPYGGIGHDPDGFEPVYSFQSNPSMWLKLWLPLMYADYYNDAPDGGSTPLVMHLDIEVLSGDGTFQPHIMQFDGYDSPWDENDPDFDWLNWGNNDYGKLGFESGGYKSLLIDSVWSQDGRYFRVADFEGAGNAVIKVHYRVPPLPKRFSMFPKDDPGSDPTITITADSIYTDHPGGSATDPVTDSQYWTPTGEEFPVLWYVRDAALPEPGIYDVWVKTRRGPTINGGITSADVAIARNGRIVTNLTGAGWGTPFAWVQLTSFNHQPTEGAYIDNSYGFDLIGPPGVAVRVGDVIEFKVIKGQSYYDAIEFIECLFVKVAAAPKAAKPISPPQDDLPLGSTGGVPLNLRTDLDGAADNWDLCVTDDDAVWLLWWEDNSDPPYSKALVLKRYEPITETWSLISNDVWGHGYYPSSPSYLTTSWGCCTIATDGTDVYCFWGERTGATSYPYHGYGGSNYEYKWRCKKYDVGLTSFIELGSASGQSYYDSTPGFLPVAAGWAPNGMKARCGPDGTPWLVWAEDRPVGEENGYSYCEAILARWSGSAWDMWRVPPPPSFTPTPRSSPTAQDYWTYQTNGVTVDAGIIQADITFCHHDGPSNTPSVWYHPWIDKGVLEGNYTSVYCEFDGSAFDNVLEIAVAEEHPYDDIANFESSVGYPEMRWTTWWHQGLALINDGETPIVALGIGGFFQGSGKIVVMKVKPDGTGAYPLRTIPGGTHPDDGAGWSQYLAAAAEYVSGHVCVAFDGYYAGGNMLMIDLDDGSGRGWCEAAEENSALTWTDFGIGRTFGHGGYVYRANQAGPFGSWANDVYPDDYAFNVWKTLITPTGLDYDTLSLSGVRWPDKGGKRIAF